MNARRAGPLLALAAVLAAGAAWGWLGWRPAPERVYVACSGGDQVAILDPTRHEVVGRLATDRRPEEVALGAGGSRLYVSNQRSGTVQVFDTATRRLLTRYVVGGRPGGLRLQEKEGLLVVARVGGGPDTVLTLEAPGGPVTVASPTLREVARQEHRFGGGGAGEVGSRAQPQGRDFFLGLDVEIPAVLVTDSRTLQVRSRIPVGERPSGIVLGPGDWKAYVAVRSEDALAVVDVGRLAVERKIPAGRGPARLLELPGGRELYAMDTDGTTVTVVRMDPGEVVKTVEVGPSPLGAAAWPPASAPPPGGP